jgi:hypothetical protein
MGDEDRWYARRVADDFVSRTGDKSERLNTIISENWWGHDKADRDELAEALETVVEDLVEPGATVTDAHRDTCEGVVSCWLSKVQVA